MIRLPQVFTGTFTLILEETPDVSHLEGKWIQTLIQSMKYLKSKICLSEP